MTFAPMLAPNESITNFDLEALTYPLMASPKLDGIRCCITEEGAVTRKLEAIPNNFIRHKLKALPIGFDGELIVGPMTGPHGEVFKRSQSGVMTEDGAPQFIFHVFDNFRHPGTYAGRYVSIGNILSKVPLDLCPAFRLPHPTFYTAAQLAAYEAQCVSEQFEGAMIRDMAGAYKFGRATMKEASLLKFKRWFDEEGEIVGFKELMRNDNPSRLDKLGHIKRSSHKANKVGMGRLGAFLIKRPTGIEFSLTVSKREDQDKFWEALNNGAGSGLMGQFAKYKFQGNTPDGKPRFPGFLGIRDRRDMS